MLILWIVASVCALQHNRLFPQLFVYLSAATLVGNVADLYVTSTLFNIPFEPNDTKEIMHPLVALIIWGPYMYLSRRVKNTFVR
jgi:Protein of unknown function (DUF2569)